MLEVKDLCVQFKTPRGTVDALGGISFQLNPGETLGIVGESGSGKSVTALSILKLLPAQDVQNIGGQILFSTPGESAIDLLSLSGADLEKVRGSRIAMIFQEPMSSLNPVLRCGHQVTEAIRLHTQMSADAAKAQALDLFNRVKLPDPDRIFNAFPHQLSGGQKQRVMIAMALSCNPSLLIADEPTTSLDVTVQKTILELLAELREASGLSMLFISHDLGVISEICDRVIVMNKGQIVEDGPVRSILENPQHPYTQGLVACRPNLYRRYRRLPSIADFLEQKDFVAEELSPAQAQAREQQLQSRPALLKVEKLSVRYPVGKTWLGRPKNWLNAVDEVSFSVFPGETFGIAGASGCGKSTLGRAIARLTDSWKGRMEYQGKELLSLDEQDFYPYRKEIQVIFQDPYASLNPRLSIGEAIMEPMKVHRLYENDKVRREKTIQLLETVGLEAEHFQRLPREFSGGQRQRICIARALGLQPRLIVCDEIVSALDVSVQATVLNLLKELQEKFDLTYLFISHDLSVIRQMCDRVMVMHQGRIEALGAPERIFATPENEYVRQLVDAIPGVSF